MHREQGSHRFERYVKLFTMKVSWSDVRVKIDVDWTERPSRSLSDTNRQAGGALSQLPRYGTSPIGIICSLRTFRRRILRRSLKVFRQMHVPPVLNVHRLAHSHFLPLQFVFCPACSVLISRTISTNSSAGHCNRYRPNPVIRHDTTIMRHSALCFRVYSIMNRSLVSAYTFPDFR